MSLWTAKLSSSRAKGRQCVRCLARDVRGMPTPLPGKRYRSFACGACNHRWTEGHRGYYGPLADLNHHTGGKPHAA